MMEVNIDPITNDLQINPLSNQVMPMEFNKLNNQSDFLKSLLNKMMVP